MQRPCRGIGYARRHIYTHFTVRYVEREKTLNIWRKGHGWNRTRRRKHCRPLPPARTYIHTRYTTQSRNVLIARGLLEEHRPYVNIPARNHRRLRTWERIIAWTGSRQLRTKYIHAVRSRTGKLMLKIWKVVSDRETGLITGLKISRVHNIIYIQQWHCIFFFGSPSQRAGWPSTMRGNK